MLVSGTPPTLGEFQEDTTITLAMRIPEPPTLVPTLALEPEDSPGPQVQPPASTTPTRTEEGEDGPRKRSHMANKKHTNSQHELWLAGLATVRPISTVYRTESNKRNLPIQI
jgi:hypothetical protein